MVRAKFKVVGNEAVPGMDGYSITLFPVVTGSEENKRFYEYTPGGSMQLSVISNDVAEQFTIGKEFYVDFNPAN